MQIFLDNCFNCIHKHKSKAQIKHTQSLVKWKYEIQWQHPYKPKKQTTHTNWNYSKAETQLKPINPKTLLHWIWGQLTLNKISIVTKAKHRREKVIDDGKCWAANGKKKWLLRGNKRWFWSNEAKKTNPN